MKIKNKSKMLLRFLLALVLISLLIPPVFTADDAQTEQKPQATGSGFRFIVLSDTNPGANSEKLHVRFPKVIAGIPQHNPVFVIHAGDMIGGVRSTSGADHIDNMWKPFFSAIKAVTEANIPYLPCPGNHDAGMGNLQLEEDYRRNWIKDDRYPAPPYNAQGNYPYYYYFDYANNIFIILDSSKGKLGQTQIQWLSQVLANAQNKENIFVIMHVPFMASGFGHGSEAEKSALDMIANAGGKIVFAGHNHEYKEHTYEGVRQITVGTAADDLRGGLKDHMFLVVDVLGKDNVKMYPAGMDSDFTKTLDGQPIPSAPTGAAPSFDPNSIMGQNCVPGTGMSSLLSGEGITYSKTPFADGFFHEIAIDPNKYDIKFVSAKKATGKNAATLEDIVRNTPGAVAGINGGFFSGGKPTHSVVEDGVLTKGVKDGSYTFVVEGGKYNVVISSEFESYSAERIKNSVSSALSAFKLVFNSVNNACTEGNCNEAHPRSGVCITKEGAIKFLASHGIQKGSSLKGGRVSIKKFAQEALDNHGCVKGINLDGGGSTSLEYHVNGQDVSLKGERSASGCGSRGFPCQRRVANALVVVPKTAVKPQTVASAQAPGIGSSSSAPTGAFTAIDSITGFTSDDTDKGSDSGEPSFTASPITPTQQIGCMCSSGTQSSLVTASSDKSGNYDFSNTEAATRGFGAKKDLSRIAKFEPYIQEASQKYGIPVEFIKGVIMVESSGNVLDSSTKAGGTICFGDKCLCNSGGYCGLMQVNKAKCERTPECNWENFIKGDAGARDQIFTGAMFIKELMTKYKNNVGPPDSPDYFYWIAIGYNGGPGSARDVREFAAERLGIPKDNVRWKDVTKADTKRNQETHFKGNTKKIDEVYYYPHKVMSVVQVASGIMPQMMQQTTGTQCSYGYNYDYVSIGKYYINPSFTTEVDYNINDYDLISNAIKGIIPGCQNKDTGSLRICIKNAVKDMGEIGDNIKLYNGPCDYAENMFSDFVEWTDACAKSKSSNCTCEIPLEYEYEKENTDEEVSITASGSGTIQISSSNPGVAPQSVSGSVSGTKEVKTKSSAEMHYAKKIGSTLRFTDSSSGKKCAISKRTYKFCAETKKLYMVYDEKEKKLALKPIQYKFAVEFPAQAAASP